MTELESRLERGMNCKNEVERELEGIREANKKCECEINKMRGEM